MPINILVADDSSSDRFIIMKLLNEYNIFTANNGLEALELIKKNNDINLIVLDLDMPQMDGFQLLTILKSNEEYKKIPVIVLTNYDEPENEVKALNLGAVDFISKPVKIELLKARIKIHVELFKARNELKEKLDEQGLTFNTIFEEAPIGIMISYGENKKVIFNSKFEEITGWGKTKLKKNEWFNMSHPEDRQQDLSLYKKFYAGEINGYAMDKRYIKPDGSVVWVHMIISLLNSKNENEFNYICLIQDITKRKIIEAELYESERSKSVLLAHIPGMAYRCKYDKNWTMEYVSEGSYELTGYLPESFLGSKEVSFREIVAPKFRDLLWEKWSKTLSEHSYFNFEYEIVTSSGEKKWVLERGQGLYDSNNNIEAIEGIILDITDRKEMENELIYNSEHDELTGLYNRKYLENLLEKDYKKKSKDKSAVIVLNLVDLQKITSNYGFHYSQELIKKLVKELVKHATDTRQLFKTFESRFSFYVKNYRGKEDLYNFCEEIIETLEEVLIIERIGCGIGISEINSKNEIDVDTLLKNALIASEKAIDIFENDFGVCFYDKDLEIEVLREQKLLEELLLISTEINKEKLFLQYQPILDLKTNEISGFEALARLNVKTLDPISPFEFIALAERSKLIIPIGKEIIFQALSFLKELNNIGFQNISVSVNISVIQLLNKGFLTDFIQTIEEIDISPQNIILEITETVFSEDFDLINEILRRFREIGIKVAIDDFGTGYSSFAREWELNIDCLKIDKYFIDRLISTNIEKALTGDIVSMAHKSGHCVIAEGVEFKEQKEYLVNCDCDKIQGYLVSEPLDEKDAIEFLRQYNKEV